MNHQKNIFYQFGHKAPLTSHSVMMLTLSEPRPILCHVKRLSTMRETRLQSLGQEDPLMKRMAIDSCIPAYRIPLTEEPGGLQFKGLQRAGYA